MMVSVDDIAPGVLNGLRVLDFTRVVAGPCLTRVLADLGAEVIKIEPPEGDLLRTGWPRRGGISVLFAGQNAGKRFMALDLANPHAVELALQLAEKCDVVVENFRPGVADKLGIGFEAIKARRPDVVYCSVSGYGQDGRASQRRAYAPVVHAEVGLLHHKAKEWEIEAKPEPVSHADIAAGMAGAHGVLAALWRRERTGQGAHVDSSMCEAMIAQNEWTEVEVNGGPDYDQSPFRPAKAAVVQLGDPEQTVVAIPGSPAAMFSVYAELSDQAELLDDERFATMASRGANMDLCLEHLARWTASFDNFDEFEKTLSEGARIPVGRVVSLADTVESEWSIDRGAYVEVPSGGETVLVHRSALRVSGTGAGPRDGVRSLGADNGIVLAELLDLDLDQVAKLLADGSIVEDPARA